mmetsp:Transcript_27302/g.44465  ORF Transcript_27302/g.44465 Transcript_27302/m.44465 type:complete len:579 (-) Transcript_27302:1032-2768(-)
MVAFRCEDLLLSGVWSFAELYCVEKTSAAPSPELYCVQTFCATTYSPSSSKPEFVSQAPPSQNLFPEGDEEPDMPVRVLMSAVPEWCESIEHCTERTYRRRAQALSSGFRSLVAVPISSSTTLPPSLTCNFPCPPDTGADPSWSSGVVVLYSETEVPYSEEALFSILNTLAGSGGKLTPENRPTVLQHPAASSPPAVNTLSSHSDQPEARSPIDVTTPTDRASNGQPSPEAPDSTNCPIPADQRVQISVNDSPSSRLVADGILSPKSSSSSTSPRTARAHISTEQTRPPSYPRHSLPTFFQQHSSSQMVSGALSPSPSISSASSSSLPLPADSHHTNIQSVSPGFQNSPVTIMHSSSSAPTSSSSSEHAAAARGLPVMESSETHHSSPSSSSSSASSSIVLALFFLRCISRIFFLLCLLMVSSSPSSSDPSSSSSSSPAACSSRRRRSAPSTPSDSFSWPYSRALTSVGASRPLSFFKSKVGLSWRKVAMRERAAMTTPLSRDDLYCVRSCNNVASMTSGIRIQISLMVLSPTTTASSVERSVTKLSTKVRTMGSTTSGGTRSWHACAAQANMDVILC